MPTDCAKELWPCPTPLFRCRTRTPEGPLCWDMKRLAPVFGWWFDLGKHVPFQGRDSWVEVHASSWNHTLFGTNIEWHREHDFQLWTIVTWLVAYLFHFSQPLWWDKTWNIIDTHQFFTAVPPAPRRMNISWSPSVAWLCWASCKRSTLFSYAQRHRSLRFFPPKHRYANRLS